MFFVVNGYMPGVLFLHGRVIGLGAEPFRGGRFYFGK